MASPSAVGVLLATSAFSAVDVSVEDTGGTIVPESFFLRLTKINAAITSTRSRIIHRHGFMVSDVTPLPTQRNLGQIQIQTVGFVGYKPPISTAAQCSSTPTVLRHSAQRLRDFPSGRTELPWVTAVKKFPNPEGVASL